MYERTYHSKVLKADTKSSKHRRFHWKRFLILLAAVAVLVGIVLLVRVPAFQVKTVAVVGTHVAEPSDVSRYVLSTFQGTRLYVLPRTSIFLISPQTVARSVQKKFPRFKSVNVTRTGMNSLKVSVEEYPGVYLWCDSSEKCSFMDDSGVVFAGAPYFSGSAYLKLYGGTRSSYPFQPLSVAQIAFIPQLVKGLEDVDVIPVSISFVSDHSVSVGFLHAGQMAQLLFDPSRDVQVSLQALYTAIHTEPLASLYSGDSKVLQYIDVRFSNKVIYKFQ